uniref:Uncharacterized protein n=1 Tax=Arion vulgaris TaxID=1028688 RepID=A0A0B7B666_9EUPU
MTSITEHGLNKDWTEHVWDCPMCHDVDHITQHDFRKERYILTPGTDCEHLTERQMLSYQNHID